jgi:sensor histidine kinase YesM
MKCKLLVLLFFLLPASFVFAHKVLDLADVREAEGSRIDTFFYDLERGTYLNYGQLYEDACNPCRLRLIVANSGDQAGLNLLRIRAFENTEINSKSGAVLPLLEADKKIYYILQVLPQTIDTFFVELYQPEGLHFFCRIHGYPEVINIINEHFPKYFDSERFFEYGFYAILLVMAIISLIYYWFLRYNHFLYYTLYVIIVLLFFYIMFTAYDALEMYHVKHYQFFQGIYLLYFLQALFYLAYFGFVTLFLNTKEQFPSLHRIIRLTVGFTLLFIAVILVDIMLTGQSIVLIFNIYRIGMVLLGLIMIVMMINKQNLLIRLILVGSIFLFLGSVLTFYAGAYLQTETLFGINRSFYMQTGVLLEMLFFSMAVAYKTHLEVVEKNKYHKALKDALQRIQKDAIEKEKELNAKIEVATGEISEKEAQKMQAVLALKEKELEIQVLRAQINPHFIFNSINALKILIHQGRNEEALRYFEKYSKLLRLILENTHERKVTLAKELETIQLYVEIENLRLKYPVSLLVNIDAEIDPDFTMLPAMLLQPFVENAIWHGLSHREEPGGSINIHIKQQPDETLIIRISDNGIGRKAAAIYRSTTQKHQSLGSLITDKRLNLINDRDDSMQYTDLFDDAGKPSGTAVTLYVQP